MLPVFKRASKSILALLGEDAFLRGEGPYKINVEHDVEIVNDDQLVIHRSVATISNDLNPKLGDQLDHPDGLFLLDAIYQDNGANKRFVLKVRSA